MLEQLQKDLEHSAERETDTLTALEESKRHIEVLLQSSGL